MEQREISRLEINLAEISGAAVTGYAVAAPSLGYRANKTLPL